MNYDNAKMELNQTVGMTGSNKSFNQIEQFEKEVAYWKQICNEQKDEMLSLYRRVHGQDGPERSY